MIEVVVVYPGSLLCSASPPRRSGLELQLNRTSFFQPSPWRIRKQTCCHKAMQQKIAEHSSAVARRSEGVQLENARTDLRYQDTRNTVDGFTSTKQVITNRLNYKHDIPPLLPLAGVRSFLLNKATTLKEKLSTSLCGKMCSSMRESRPRILWLHQNSDS